MRKLTADRIFTGTNGTLTEKVIILDEEGKILSIDNAINHDPASVQKLNGTLIPGYINTHCHLELSHMKGLVETGTGLIPFISKVVKFRDFPQEEILEGIHDGDKEMYNNGIVAVGDICNKIDTKLTKENSKIAYYSFIEMFDFLQESMTDHFFNEFISAYNDHSNKGTNKKSLVPHAPYSVSPELFHRINAINSARATISIHNQECHDENALFLNKSGALLDFYKGLGMNMDEFVAPGTPSIDYALQYLDPNQKTILVHNTVCTKEDVQKALDWNPQSYWATCPNANLYIENKLPDYQIFIDLGTKMTIGTDSLSSNWQLDIWEEIKTIKRYNSYIGLETLLTWATINGATSLDYHTFLGSIEIGKQPGLNLINHVLGDTEDNLEKVVSTKIL
jgi:cytosine/adenosine deaminase-related metal-dependent hydrolase